MNQMAIRDLKKVARNVQEAKNSFFSFFLFTGFLKLANYLHDAIVLRKTYVGNLFN
jgi:hypothetical protein